MADLEAVANPSPKYRRARITLDLGVSAHWMDDGGHAELIRAIESIMLGNGTGVGPGGAILHRLFTKCWRPGQEPEEETELRRMRNEYPLSRRVFPENPGLLGPVDHAGLPGVDYGLPPERWKQWAANQVEKDHEQWKAKRANVPRHKFAGGHSGVSCVEMVVLTNGTGDVCGFDADAEVHLSLLDFTYPHDNQCEAELVGTAGWTSCGCKERAQQ